VKAQQVNLRELVGNTLYNTHRRDSDIMFPSAAQPEAPKPNPDVKGRVGRPRKTDAQKAIENISSYALTMLSRMEKQVKDEYKYQVTVPSFSFDADGGVIMPPPPPPPEKTKKKRKRRTTNARADISDGETSPQKGATSARGPGSGASQANVRPTAKRRKILQPSRRDNESSQLQSDIEDGDVSDRQTVAPSRQKDFARAKDKGKGRQREVDPAEDALGGFLSLDEDGGRRGRRA
jgi:hypothetical protein